VRQCKRAPANSDEARDPLLAPQILDDETWDALRFEFLLPNQQINSEESEGITPDQLHMISTKVKPAKPDDDCVVCFDALGSAKTKVIRLNACGHEFHKD
jgi:hypothetical protein